MTSALLNLFILFLVFQTEPSRKPNKVTSQKYSHTIFMAVRNFVCKISEDAELLFTLYDAKQQKSFTENFVVQWHQDNAASDINHFYYNLRVLFSVSNVAFSSKIRFLRNRLWID